MSAIWVPQFVFYRTHFVSQTIWRPKIFPFSTRHARRELIIISACHSCEHAVTPINFIDVILYTGRRQHTRVFKIHIDKVEWVMLTTVQQAEITFIQAQFKLKVENLGPRHCLTKCAISKTNYTLNQNCRSWYNFSQEKIPHPLIPFIVSTMGGGTFGLVWEGRALFTHNGCPPPPQLHCQSERSAAMVSTYTGVKRNLSLLQSDAH